MSIEENKRTARAFMDAFNRMDMAGLESRVSDAVVNHALPPGMPAGKEGWKALAHVFWTGFPDMRVTVDDVIGEGDRVAYRWTAQGTHTGEMMGIAPTGRSVTLTGITIDRYDDTGLIVEHWESYDQLGMLQQLGVIPTPRETAS
jgi:steroid delta-isomerase-like uncharacterized protein